MKNVFKKDLPKISVVITAYNAERTLPTLLKSFEEQDYPRNHIEILLVDGNSKDRTVELAKKSHLDLKIVPTDFPKDPEACRVFGVRKARYEILCFIDADNYLPRKNWIRNVIQPLIDHQEVYASYAMRYLHNREEMPLNRYFSLLGAADPVGFYLGKDDRLSYLYDEWNLYGKILENNKQYTIVQFDPYHFPTLGTNGFFFRKSLLLKNLKITPENFFHIDSQLDMAKKGVNIYGIVKEEIGHNATDSMWSFLRRRVRYMGLHYLSRSGNRRYKVFDPSRNEDRIHLLLFMIYSLTFVQPFIFAFLGYMKRRDPAWFIHPIFSFLICFAYIYAVINGFLQMKILHRKLQ